MMIDYRQIEVWQTQGYAVKTDRDGQEHNTHAVRDGVTLCGSSTGTYAFGSDRWIVKDTWRHLPTAALSSITCRQCRSRRAYVLALRREVTS